MASISDILETIRGYSADADMQVVMTAYLLSARAHAGQTRKSGEPYLSHPMAVAKILADARMDVDTIATALLHDALEDNPITMEEMEAEIGPVITKLVDGVTKIGKLRYRSQEELAAENFRKMMLAMSQDLRVILVKLADRLHNMSTLEHHKPEKQKKIARETLEIYVPLANRLGLERFKGQLETYCFRYLEPEGYQEVLDYLSRTGEDREAYAKTVVAALQEQLKANGLEAQVKGRVKHPFSIWRKTQQQGLALQDVHDLIAFRVIVNDVGQCYHALGLVHSSFPPVPDRIKDYIARPKPNGYQSLHTTVSGPQERRVEIQIRTAEMDRIAEEGIAAHWRYKEGHLALSPEDVIRISKIKELFNSARDADSATEFMEAVKVEFYAEEVFVFTPAGDIKRFPAGATALDFAYAVHTDVGYHCVGAKRHGKMVPLRYELQSGDALEIMTSESQRPNRDWLKIARTGRALQKIRKELRSEEQSQGARLGREMIEAELKRFEWSMKRVEKEGRLKAAMKSRGFKELEKMLVDVARGQLSLSDVVRDMLPEGVFQSRQQEAQQNALSSLFNRFRKPSQSPVLITGEDGLLVTYARCCSPLPGEMVVGFITRGRGITVHKAVCPQLAAMDPDRHIAVEWDGAVESRHTGEIVITCNNRPGMLANITKCCEQVGVNIQRAETRSHGDQGIVTLQVAIRDLAELSRLIKNIEKIKGVESVDRAYG